MKKDRRQRKKLAGKKRGHMRCTAKVLIVTPTPLDHSVDLRVAVFCASAIARGIADWMPTPAREAENARNQVFREGLASETRYTHFFLLDADSFPYEPFMIERLLGHNKLAVAGPTPVQREGKEKWDFGAFTHATVVRGKIQRLWNVVVEKDGARKTLKRSDDPNNDELPERLFKAQYVGSTGFLVARELIEKMPEPYQKTERDVHGKTTLSEDYYFCEQIHKLGHSVWIDPAVISGHNNSIDIGNY